MYKATALTRYPIDCWRSSFRMQTGRISQRLNLVFQAGLRFTSNFKSVESSKSSCCCQLEGGPVTLPLVRWDTWSCPSRSTHDSFRLTLAVWMNIVTTHERAAADICGIVLNWVIWRGFFDFLPAAGRNLAELGLGRRSA